MGFFDSLFGKRSASKEANKQPPIYGGDALSPNTAATINCASMDLANHLIDQFISERHGVMNEDWKRGMEFFVNSKDIPEFTVRSIRIESKTNSNTAYYFNIARPMNATKKLLSMLQESDETIEENNQVEERKVTAHILDPKTGYLKQEWVVGEHVSEDTVLRLSDGENIYVVVAYEKGKAEHAICKKEIWLHVKSQFEDIEQA